MTLQEEIDQLKRELKDLLLEVEEKNSVAYYLEEDLAHLQKLIRPTMEACLLILSLRRWGGYSCPSDELLDSHDFNTLITLLEKLLYS